MTKELAKKESTDVSTEVITMRKQEILSGDMPIPRLYLMQKTSDLVETGEARPGDFIRSTNKEKIGDSKAPVDIIPLKMTTEWLLEEKIDDRFKWRGREPRDAGNENLPWLFTDRGTEWRRVKVINLFAMLVSDLEGREAKVKAAIERGELPEPSTPIVITFRSTSFPAGKEVTKFFVQVEEIVTKYGHKVAPYMYALPLGNEREENDKGSFQVLTVGKAKKVSEEAAQEAGRWYNLITDPSLDLNKLNIDSDDTAVDEDKAAAQKANSVRKKEASQF